MLLRSSLPFSFSWLINKVPIQSSGLAELFEHWARYFLLTVLAVCILTATLVVILGTKLYLLELWLGSNPGCSDKDCLPHVSVHQCLKVLDTSQAYVYNHVVDVYVTIFSSFYITRKWVPQD